MSEPNPYEGPKLIIDNDKLGENAPKAPLKSGNGGDRFDGMDGWQTSVEARLGGISSDIRDLRSDIGGVRSDLSSVKVDLATLGERVTHLPSKGFIVRVSLAALAFVTAVVTFQAQIQAFLKLH